ncbi:alpha/beta fold hydrolase [Massilia sp. Dwa41.01b]|uniref:alpha/beta fold hydrolase n=1 Tax=Massilia sp. Dwa41.01b TaxID=2709302 RepID=UPI00280605B2|nr:alpha/beta fold hydrolase [Massilia sp. Dwa41.01b]
MQKPTQLLFLPGASGQTQFWHPVADLLSCLATKVHVGWPGFGDVPRDPAVRDLDDLADMVAGQIDRPTALVAQSMGA